MKKRYIEQISKDGTATRDDVDKLFNKIVLAHGYEKSQNDMRSWFRVFDDNNLDHEVVMVISDGAGVCFLEDMYKAEMELNDVHVSTKFCGEQDEDEVDLFYEILKEARDELNKDFEDCLNELADQLPMIGLKATWHKAFIDF